MRKIRARIAKAIIPAARVSRALLVLSMAGAFATSCKDSNDPGVLSTLAVAPNPATVAAGQTVQFTASGTDFTGASVVPNAGAVVWSVVNGGGSINSSTGVFTAVTTAGTYTNTILATCRGITATATVIVTAGPLATITVTPNPTLVIGTKQTFTATGADAFGNAVVINPSWTAVAGGTIPAGSTGTTVVYTAGNTPGVYNPGIRATQGSISGTANVTVIAGPLATITVTPNPKTLVVGTTATFTAVGTDAGGNVVPINPSWTAVAGGSIPTGSTGTTVVYTAGNTPSVNTPGIRATQGTVSGTADITVVAGPLATITVTPNPKTLAVGTTATFTATGADALGNAVAINPTWTAVAGGTVPAGSTGTTVVYTAGNAASVNTPGIRATQGSISGTADITVTAPTTPPASTFSLVARVAYTCTNGTIVGDVGTNQTAAEVPPGSVTQTLCPITGGTAQVGTAAAKTAYQNFLTTYTADSAISCVGGTTLTGTQAGAILAPGVYCFSAAATLTGTLTLSGPAGSSYLFKVGTSGTGALSGTNFNVVMAGGASSCNVVWLVQDASTFVDSNFKGTILGGAGVSFTRGTVEGSAYSKQDVTLTGAAGTPLPLTKCIP